jgi:DNA replication and repair protein RecF
LILQSLLTRSFRNLVDSDWSFHPSVNLFVGDNGQGKTNLLEAIYMLSSTRSFRPVRAQGVIRIGAGEFYLAGKIDDASIEKSLSIGVAAGEERKRELQVNGQRVTIRNYVQQLPVFAYSSDLLELVRGGPELRRRFVDRGVSWRDPEHLDDVSRLHKVLQQRNALLDAISRRAATRAALEPWNVELVTIGQRVARRRHDYIAHLQKEQRAISATHAYHVDDLTIAYKPAGIGAETADPLAVLAEALPRDLRVGYTTVGPHRDAIEISSRERPAAEILSSGEIKMTVLFLVLAAIRLYEEARQRWPILLLDDLDAELDLGILKRLIRFLVGSTQLFTTSAKQQILGDIDFGPHREFVLSKGAPQSIRDLEN